MVNKLNIIPLTIFTLTLVDIINAGYSSSGGRSSSGRSSSSSFRTSSSSGSRSSSSSSSHRSSFSPRPASSNSSSHSSMYRTTSNGSSSSYNRHSDTSSTSATTTAHRPQNLSNPWLWALGGFLLGQHGSRSSYSVFADSSSSSNTRNNTASSISGDEYGYYYNGTSCSSTAKDEEFSFGGVLFNCGVNCAVDLAASSLTQKVVGNGDTTQQKIQRAFLKSTIAATLHHICNALQDRPTSFMDQFIRHLSGGTGNGLGQELIPHEQRTVPFSHVLKRTAQQEGINACIFAPYAFAYADNPITAILARSSVQTCLSSLEKPVEAIARHNLRSPGLVYMLTKNARYLPAEIAALISAQNN